MRIKGAHIYLVGDSLHWNGYVD